MGSGSRSFPSHPEVKWVQSEIWDVLMYLHIRSARRIVPLHILNKESIDVHWQSSQVLAGMPNNKSRILGVSNQQSAACHPWPAASRRRGSQIPLDIHFYVCRAVTCHEMPRFSLGVFHCLCILLLAFYLTSKDLGGEQLQ